MRRLWAVVGLGMTLLVVTIAFAITISRRIEHGLTLLSTTPNGRPCEGWCLFGAQPVWMTYAQVQSQLLKHPLLQGLHVESRPNTYDYFFGQTVDVNHVLGLVSVSFHTRRQCRDDYPECHAHANNTLLESFSNHLPLEAIIRDWGVPDFIELDIDTASPYLSLYYRDSYLSFRYVLGQQALIQPTDAIASIDLYSADAFEDFTRDHIKLPWPGFGPIPPLPR